MPKKQLSGPPKIKEGLTTARLYLQEFAEQIAWVFSHKNYLEFEQYQEMKNRRLIKEQREWLRELKKRKWIATKKIGNRIMARLTEQGWQNALRDRIRLEKHKRADGVCIIIFDVPENQRHIRNTLRKFLKECKFQKLQHSVWMTEKDVLEPLMLLLQRRKLDQWIRIIQGKVLQASIFDPIRYGSKKYKN